MKSAVRAHARCAGGARTAFALAGTERKYERSRPFVIRHLALEVDLDFDERSVTALATIEFSRVDPKAEHLVLDAVGFEIDRLEVIDGGWTSSAYDYDGDKLAVSVPRTVTDAKVRISYRARPRRGLYFLRPDAAVSDRPVQAWTQCQDEDARHWFPCHDKPNIKMSTELQVTVPRGFTALSNGELLEQATSDAHERWSYHFRIAEPHPSYLVTLVVGRFEILSDRDAVVGDEGRRIPVRYYVPPGKADEARRSFGQTPRMIELFSRLSGVEFPWSRYSQIVVSDFIFGGMENTTASTMYEYILLDEKAALDVSSHDLVAHELAHQWFGDYVTCRDWSHAWLNEGFATFFEHVEREDRLGRDEYDYGIAADLDSYLREASKRYTRAIVCRDYQEPIDLFDRHLYEKGGLVLHMLRRELGDPIFWQGVRLYLSRHRHGLVETNDLERALEEVSGRSLERFFDQWVHRPGHPVLKVKIAWEDGLCTVQAKQRQREPDVAVFSYDLEIEIGHKSGAVTRHKKAVQSAADTLVVPLDERPTWVAFDPEQRIVGDVGVEAPADMLERQLSQGSSASIRWRAAEALSRRDTPSTIMALAAALANEQEAWMVRAEAARALGKIRGRECFAALASAVATEHPKVRRAVVAALGNFRTSEALALLEPLLKKDSSYLVESEAARAAGRTRQKAALEPLLAIIDRTSWADVVRSGAVDGIAELREDAGILPVMERTRYGIPSRGRRAAIGALARLSDTRKVREHLEDLLDDVDPHVRIDVVGALATLGDPKSRQALRQRLDRELDGRVARRIREALRELGAAAEAEHKRLRDELESVRGELVELKVRLAKLEVGKPNGGVPLVTAKAKSKRRGVGAASAKRKSAKSQKTARSRSSKNTTLRSKARDESGPRPR